MEKEMELMDWKDIEHGAESQIRDARKGLALGEILLTAARLRIHELGGRTNEDDDKTAQNVRGD